MNVVETGSLTELSAHGAAWDDLARHAGDQNVFFERWMLTPALKHYTRHTARTVLVFDGASLIGLVPVRHRLAYKGMPAPHWSVWEHVHCYLCTPLIRAGCEQAFLSAFFNRLDETTTVAMFGAFVRFDRDGTFSRAINDLAAHEGRPLRTTRETSRALLRSDMTVDGYLRRAYSTKHRKELARLRRRLADLGTLRSTSLVGSGDVEPWIDGFLGLEARGWKGRKGTALKASEADRAFFRDTMRGANENEQLFLAKLAVDNELVAMLISFMSADRKAAFSFKIAFDERFAKYSPGVLVEVENLRAVLEHPTIQWMDSCASPRHNMINRLWTERRVLRDVSVGSRHILSGLTVSAVAKAVHAYRSIRPRGKPDAVSPAGR